MARLFVGPRGFSISSICRAINWFDKARIPRLNLFLECTDLVRKLMSYRRYFNESRGHHGIDGITPVKKSHDARPGYFAEGISMEKTLQRSVSNADGRVDRSTYFTLNRFNPFALSGSCAPIPALAYQFCNDYPLELRPGNINSINGCFCFGEFIRT